MKRPAAILLAFVLSRVLCDSLDATLKHANHIFNEIHSSARQWGSTLNHNGMAFFMATVPEGTELYHGTSSALPKTGMDWLAFEPEHALVFARPGSNRPDDNGNEGHPKAEAVTHGYLHTFRIRQDLRLLYLDGASAAKSDRGTLDLQDVVLLNQTPKTMTGRRSFYEHEEDSARAAGLCRMAQGNWKGRLDGFIRMEAGFEIILCDFESHLQPVRVTQSKPQDGAPGAIPDSPAFFKAIAGRYDGIGGDRLVLDYETHVSLFACPDAFYFDGWKRPRVNHTGAAIETVRNAVTSMILAKIPRFTRRIDWQSIADMIVGRYADRIEYLASGEIDSLTNLRFEAERSLRPFIDYSRLNKSAEVSRCVDHLIPPAGRGDASTAARAIIEVNTMICQTLSRIAHSNLDGLSHGLSLARALKKWLAWTEWKKCKGCKPNEFCFTPLWPLGAAEDFETPRCVSNFKGVGRDYWHTELPVRRVRRADTCPRMTTLRIFSVNGSCPAGRLSRGVQELNTSGMASYDRACLGSI